MKSILAFAILALDLESVARAQEAHVSESSPPVIVPLARPAALYPPGLLRKCVGGQVDFRFSVGESGRVVDFIVLSSPHPDLARVTERTVRSQWLFKPFTPQSPGQTVFIQSFVRFDPDCSSLPPNNSSKPTPLRGAA